MAPSRIVKILYTDSPSNGPSIILEVFSCRLDFNPLLSQQFHTNHMLQTSMDVKSHGDFVNSLSGENPTCGQSKCMAYF